MPRLAARLDGAWEVAFEAERGAPKAASLPALAPLNEQVDPGIRYFSGIATYGKTFAAPAGYKPGAPLLLDLAQVGDLAEVRVNGRLIGTLWHSPSGSISARWSGAGPTGLKCASPTYGSIA
ncbi:hypothetical protein NRB_44600 [Novosphingobium sp. 11B]